MATSKSIYRFIEDPGHGWLEVSTAELAKLGIADKISSCSYQTRDGRTAYLEEDCDLSVWAAAKGYKYPEKREEFREFWDSRVQSIHQENTFIRNLPSYQPVSGAQ